jgi:AICAR transformylase/IMP cyclohydrolase PurH
VTSQTPESQAIEQIDIGGVSLIRAAAKNFAHVSVLTNPNQYELFCQQQPTTMELRREFARCAFELTAKYDSRIAQYAGLLVLLYSFNSINSMNRYFSGSGLQNLKQVTLPERFKQTREYELIAPLKFDFV